MQAREYNFDGIPGPTHNYAALSYGNLASLQHGGRVSHPRAAVLQGLAKMKRLHDLGAPQAVLPPHPRPDLDILRRLGFGSDRPGDDGPALLQRAAHEAPELLARASSASAMWTANAATVSPSADTQDGRLHFTPANLSASLHRSIEAPQTARILQRIFSDPAHFAHHPPLPSSLGDEGAANHTRLASEYGAPGLELFVYGASLTPVSKAGQDDDSGPIGETGEIGQADAARPMRFPARQLREASEAVARLHRLAPERALFLQQNPEAIDAGVFHNDVICVGDRNQLFLHAAAFAEGERALARIRAAWESVAPESELRLHIVSERELSLAECVRTYLLNSQIIQTDSGERIFAAPEECCASDAARGVLERWRDRDGAFERIEFFDLRESMQNGGGPACLRLRVVLTQAEQAAAHPGVFFTDRLYNQLVEWAERCYREELRPHDLGDPQLLHEGRRALDELTQILDLGSIYDFQGGGA